MLIQVFQQLGQRRVGKAVLERRMQSSASMATECMPAAKAAQSTGEDLNTDSLTHNTAVPSGPANEPL